MVADISAMELFAMLTPVYTMQLTGVYYQFKQNQAIAKVHEAVAVETAIRKACPNCPKVT